MISTNRIFQSGRAYSFLDTRAHLGKLICNGYAYNLEDVGVAIKVWQNIKAFLVNYCLSLINKIGMIVNSEHSGSNIPEHDHGEQHLYKPQAYWIKGPPWYRL